MNRKIKVLGLALIAVLAMTAVAASSASATKFTAAKYPAAGHGVQSGTHLFETTKGEVKCTTATFTGTLTAASETLTVKPVYTGCTALFFEAKVTGFGHYGEANPCVYVFNTNGKVDLNCPAGGPGEVYIDAGPCDITIPAQKNLATNTYTNTPASKVTVDTKVVGITYTMIKTNFLCPETAGEFSDGAYTGTTVISATNEGAADAIDVG